MARVEQPYKPAKRPEGLLFTGYFAVTGIAIANECIEPLVFSLLIPAIVVWLVHRLRTLARIPADVAIQIEETRSYLTDLASGLK